MDQSMQLVFHGAYCCGMKTIRGFGCCHSGTCRTDSTTPALLEIQENNGDRYGHSVAGKRFFHEEAPEESRLDRLDRYLEYLDRRRSQGICEVILRGKSFLFDDAAKAEDGGQIPVWESVLLERGFKIVNTWKNSNSMNFIRVYHRNSGEVPKAVFPRVAVEEKGE